MQTDSIEAALRLIAIQKWLSLAAVVSCIVVPVLGIWGLRRTTRNRSTARASATWATGCLVLVVYGGVAFVFGVCTGAEFPESGKARLARALGEPVVNALGAHHEASGSYPGTLAELVPQYLTGSALRAPENSPLGHPFRYDVDSGRYELSVSYVGPGMNTCSFRPDTKWRCGGFF